jgi:hypothetical protein
MITDLKLIQIGIIHYIHSRCKGPNTVFVPKFVRQASRKELGILVLWSDK